MSKEKEYTNGDVTVVWKPDLCIHSGIYVQGLPDVFQPKDRPWIKIDAAKTDQIIDQVKACPSGALSYFMNDGGNENQASSETQETVVEVMKNGPLLVYGTVKVTNHDGSTEVKNKTTAFCRCGQSANKPYCDGAHKKVDFKG